MSRLSSRASTHIKESSDSSHSLETVRVIVRCRPLNENERRRQEKMMVKVTSHDEVKVCTEGPNGTISEKPFRFNAAIGPECSQEDFFNVCGVKTLLDSALNGYAATVFAYGQTGSGKTYSMSGTEEQISREGWSGESKFDGLVPRSIKYLFHQIRSEQTNNKSKGGFQVKASYCEIYNEQVFDLLNPTQQSLAVRWNSQKGFFVQDLFVVECNALEDVMEVVSEGHRNRRVGSHEMNKDSSRSHSILTLHIHSESIDPEDGHNIAKFGKMVFVDLAGSERLKDSKSEGLAMTETGAINKSLFTLSNVISALSNMQHSPQPHIPYRDSKLTKLLMDCLGGTSLSLMVACFSPAGAFMEETMNTLKYATRAGMIKNKPTLQLDSKEQLIARLRREIQLLKTENEYLRKQAGIVDEPLVPRSPVSSNNSLPIISTTPRRKIQIEAEDGLVPPGLGSRALQKTVGPAQDSEMHHILLGYQKEIQRLKLENRDVRTREIIAGRSFQSVMSENESLHRKLEHLEEIFIHSNEHEKNPPSNNAMLDKMYAIQNQNEELQHQISQLQNALKVNSNQIKIENESLKAQVQEFRNREELMSSSIKPDENFVEDSDEEEGKRAYLFD